MEWENEMSKMMKVTTPKVPEPNPAIFDNCRVVGDTVFMAGMTAGDGKGGAIGGDSMYGQAKACFEKVKHLVEAAGGTMADVMKMTIYVTDMGGRADLGRARGEFFSPGKSPCSTLVEVKSLAQPGLKIEIDATAVLGAGG
jgi:enamine deaminase RidA (YjgF/YER057c/UK114 family)